MIDPIKTRLDFFDPWPQPDPDQEEKNSVNLMLIGFITGIESYLPFASMVERSKSNSVCICLLDRYLLRKSVVEWSLTLKWLAQNRFAANLAAAMRLQFFWSAFFTVIFIFLIIFHLEKLDID